MIRALCGRLGLTLINIFFPPLAVYIVAGAGMDVVVNCLLFLLAVIPSHIHGFYISWTAFFRRRKAKKGQYPGGPKPLIYSEKVLNGGLSNAEVEQLRRNEYGSEKKQNSVRRGQPQYRNCGQQRSSRPVTTARQQSQYYQLYNEPRGNRQDYSEGLSRRQRG